MNFLLPFFTLLFNLLRIETTKINLSEKCPNNRISKYFFPPPLFGWVPVIPPPVPVFNHFLPCWCPLQYFGQNDFFENDANPKMLESTYMNAENRKNGVKSNVFNAIKKLITEGMNFQCIRGVPLQDLNAIKVNDASCNKTHEAKIKDQEGKNVPLTKPPIELKCCQKKEHNRSVCAKVGSNTFCQCIKQDDPCPNGVTPCCGNTDCETHNDKKTKTCRGMGSCIMLDEDCSKSGSHCCKDTTCVIHNDMKTKTCRGKGSCILQDEDCSKSGSICCDGTKCETHNDKKTNTCRGPGSCILQDEDCAKFGTHCCKGTNCDTKTKTCRGPGSCILQDEDCKQNGTPCCKNTECDKKTMTCRGPGSCVWQDDPCKSGTPCCKYTECYKNTTTCRGAGSCVWEGGKFCGCSSWEIPPPKCGRVSCCHGVIDCPYKLCETVSVKCRCKSHPTIEKPAIPDVKVPEQGECPTLSQNPVCLIG